MSLNQSRANKNESHYRKTGRPAYSAQQRGSSGRGGKGGCSTGLPPSPSSSSNTESSSFLTNRSSFKKSNGLGAQSWVIAASANSDSNATVSRAAQNAVQNGARAQSPLLDFPVSDVTIKKSSDLSSQSRNRAVPRAPSSQSTSGTSDSKASTSTTHGDASGSFSPQFGSFVNGMQIHARTSSAHPNLYEQKHDQFGNLGIGINPQFAQQQAPRIAVKIIHPETHEELRLDGGSLGPRSHPKSLQSLSIPYASTHQNVNGGLVRILPSGSKGKPTLEVNRVKSTIARGRKKIKEILQKANAAGTSDLYLAYKGPKEKLEPTISLETVDSTSSIDARQISLDVKEEDAVASKGDGKSEAEQDNWEDAADISCPKLKISNNGEQVHGGLRHREEDVNGVMGKRKYSRDFLLTFSGQCTDLPAGFEIKYDIVEALMGSKASISKHVDRYPYPSSGRIIDRPTVVSRPDQCGSGMVGVGRWNKSPGPIASRHNPRLDISQGSIAAEHVDGAGVVAGNEHAAEPISERAAETTCTLLGTEVREDLEPMVQGSVEGFIEFTIPQEFEEDCEKVSASEDDSESNVYHEERLKRGQDVRIKSKSGSRSGSGSDEDIDSGSGSESGSGEDSDTEGEGEGEESESDGEEGGESESDVEEIVTSRSTKGKEKVVAKGKWKAKSKGISQPSSFATTEFPGGPKKMDILKGFETHVARYIWDGQDREPLKCIQHVTKIYEWHWKTECKRFKKRVNNTPLCQLIQVSYTHINRVLISAFVERWHPETNTFHLPFGEMTITLDDVKQITGLPVVGKGVRAPDIRKEDAIGLLHKFLGVSREAALDELKNNKCNYVRMEWLRKTFGNKAKKSDSNADIDRHVRAYLLYLLGCTLFSDETGTKVPVTYLNFLSDVGNVANYAWGAAGLAYLYRQLGVATRVEVKQIAGYLTLMEHFTVERPTPDLQYVNGNPRAMKWKPRSSVSAVDAPNKLKFLRQQIDNIIKENVIWDPYSGSRDAHPFQDIAWYCGCIIFCDMVEPYHPARVLRQFGYVQTSQWNHAPIPPTKAKRGAKANLYFVKHIYVEYIWTTWSHHCLSVSSRGELCKADSPWMCEDGYEEWYSERSHVRIHSTDSTSTSDHPIPRSFRDAYIDLNNRRKKALTLLQEGEKQTLHDILKRERLIASILNDDTIADTAQASVAEI